MNNHLEQAVLHGAILGYLSPSQLKSHLRGFSKEGKCVAAGVKWLIDQGQLPPYTLSSVVLTCTDVLGFEDEAIAAYVNEMASRAVGLETSAILDGAMSKFKLLELQALINEQTASRTYDPAKIQDLLAETTNTHTNTLVSLAEMAGEWGKDGDDGRTVGITIGDRYPRLQEETGGVSGMWVIGGLTGVGKSTLAYHLALICGRSRQVLYYDMENTNRRLWQRTVRIFNGDTGQASEATRSVFIRPDPKSVWGDVRKLDGPSVIVIDSLQKLPSDIHVKRETMEDWLQRLDKLKQQGHSIIIISQLNRAEGNYKGTNDIEHTADFAIKLDSSPEDPNTSEVYITKNRHGAKLNYACTLRRENIWTMREV